MTTRKYRPWNRDQGYNPQIVVDAKHRGFVSAGVTNKAPDKGNLAPMILRVQQNPGRLPEVVTADSGNRTRRAFVEPVFGQIKEARGLGFPPPQRPTAS